MDINGKNTKTQKTTRKITRRSTLKYSIGSAVAENSPTPIEAPPEHRKQENYYHSWEASCIKTQTSFDAWI